MNATLRYTKATGDTDVLEGVLEGGFDVKKDFSGHIGNSHVSVPFVPPIAQLSCEVSHQAETLTATPPFGYAPNQNRHHTQMRARGGNVARAWRGCELKSARRSRHCGRGGGEAWVGVYRGALARPRGSSTGQFGVTLRGHA